MYSELLWDHYESPRHQGCPASPIQEVHKANPICGDSLSFYLCLAETGQAQLWFTATGCPPVIACASWVCEWASGRPKTDLAGLELSHLQNALGPLPPNKQHAFQMCLWAVRDLCR